MSLPEPEFFSRDPAAITAELVAAYEAATGKTLYPAQVERILIDLVAYRETQLRIAAQEAAKQLLVAYSRAPVLDYLGELVDTARLAARPATCLLRFSFTAPLAAPLTVAAGLQVRDPAGNVTFATAAAFTAPAGAAHYDAAATATAAGTLGNGWAIGQVNQPVAPLPDPRIASVANLTAPAGGADAEDDERYRARIKAAPDAFSVAGPVGAYKFWARSAHPDIIDVAVLNHYPDPGQVSVFPLVAGGVPSTAVLDAVAAILSDEDIRPVNDEVLVTAPTPVDYALSAALTLYVGVDPASTLAAAQAAAEAYRDRLAGRLGRDIVLDQIKAALMVEGVYSVALTLPAAGAVLAPNEWPRCTGITLSVAGTVDG